MKTPITNYSIFDNTDPRRRAATTVPRNKPQITSLMRKLRVMVLWMLLGAATPLYLQAQSTETYTFTTNRLVPDGNAAGLSDVRTLNSAIGDITSVTVHLKTTGEFNGDLYGYVTHSSGFTVLLNRPGKTASSPAGYADSGLDVTFQDSAANGDIHLYQNKTTPVAGSPLTGAWQPDDRTQPGRFRLRAAVARRGQAHHNVQPRIAQIQRVCVTLAAIADNPDGLTFKEADIAILFVVTLRHLFENSV